MEGMVQGILPPVSTLSLRLPQGCGLQLPLRCAPHPPCLRHLPDGWQRADPGVPELGERGAI